MADDATLPMTYASPAAPNLPSFSYGHFKIWSRDTPDRDFPQSTKHDGTLHPPITYTVATRVGTAPGHRN